MLRFIPIYLKAEFKNASEKLICNQTLYITRFLLNYDQMPRVPLPDGILEEDIQTVIGGKLPDCPLQISHLAIAIEINNRRLLRKLAIADPHLVMRYPERISLSQAEIFLRRVKVKTIPNWAIDYPSLVRIMREHWKKGFRVEPPKGHILTLDYVEALSKQGWDVDIAKNYLHSNEQKIRFYKNYPRPEKAAFLLPRARIPGLNAPCKSDRRSAVETAAPEGPPEGEKGEASPPIFGENWASPPKPMAGENRASVPPPGPDGIGKNQSYGSDSQSSR